MLATTVTTGEELQQIVQLSDQSIRTKLSEEEKQSQGFGQADKEQIFSLGGTDAANLPGVKGEKSPSGAKQIVLNIAHRWRWLRFTHSARYIQDCRI